MKGHNFTIFTPGVGQHTLMATAGFMWLAVSYMLCHYAIIWYENFTGHGLLLFILLGISSGLVIHHWGFLRIVNKNIFRIKALEERHCLFGFMPWKSYLLIAVMMTFGILLRNSAIPRIYLSVIYMGIGLALGLSSIRYFRHALSGRNSKS